MQISNSIRLSLAGKAVDWTTKTSSPRTFSRISTKISSSAKRRTLAWVIGSSRYWAIACTRGRFELPDSSFIGPFSLLARIHVSLFTPYEKGKGIAAGSDDMAGQVTFTPTEADIVAGSRDWFRRMLMQPRIKGACYVAIRAGGLLGAAFALQAAGPPERALRAAALGALVGLALFGGILAARWAMLPGQALRAFRQNKTIHHPYTYAWTDEGISFESEAASARVAWRDLYRWGEGRSA